MPASPSRRILAIDGGGFKTDVVLADEDGRLLGAMRVPVATHAGLGRAGAGRALDDAIRQASRAFRLGAVRKPIAEVGVYSLAGADLPADDRRIHRELTAHRWTARSLVRNDTLAVLRAGTDRGWGVAIVCGSGMNAAGVGPDGASVRFLAFGEISGDLAAGGGYLGLMGLAHAMRAEDGRGPATTLEQIVPRFFDLRSPSAVIEAIYLGKLESHRLVELAPLVFGAAHKRDRVARSIVDQVADEVVAFARATIKRLGVARLDVEVILGGGVVRTDDAAFHRRIREGIHETAPRARIRRLDAPPVLGAALLALDELGAGPTAVRRLRAALTYERLTPSIRRQRDRSGSSPSGHGARSRPS